MNYRSVVIVGIATEVTDREQKRSALASIVDHAVPGRSSEARPPTDKEAGGTLVLAVSLTEASAKVRAGPPIDDDSDLAVAVWAGVIPLRLAAGSPVPAPGLDPSHPVAGGDLSPRFVSPA